MKSHKISAKVENLTFVPDKMPVNFDEADKVFAAIAPRSAAESSPAKLATFPEAFNDFSCGKQDRKLKYQIFSMIFLGTQTHTVRRSTDDQEILFSTTF